MTNHVKEEHQDSKSAGQHKEDQNTSPKVDEILTVQQPSSTQETGNPSKESDTSSPEADKFDTSSPEPDEINLGSKFACCVCEFVANEEISLSCHINSSHPKIPLPSSNQEADNHSNESDTSSHEEDKIILGSKFTL